MEKRFCFLSNDGEKINSFSKKEKFILESIKDLQSSIRAMDQKQIYLASIMIVPLLKIDFILKNISNWGVFFVVGCCFWSVSLLFSLYSMLSLCDAENIFLRKCNYPCFFPLKQIKLNIYMSIEKKINIADKIKNFNKINITACLLREQYKLSFILKIKIEQCKFVKFFILCAIGFFVLSFIF